MTALPGSGLVGIATSKKIGTTPQRNRAKRRLREALRANEAVLNPRLDFVALAMPESVGASLEALIADTGRLLRSLTERWAAESESS
jgi:ribonuclease P protein component